MEVSNHERKFLKFFAGGLFLIILLAVPTGRWVHDFLWEKQPEWANVDGVIPAVQHYDFDSTGWNIISEADYILDPAMGPESYRIVSSPNGIMVTHGDLGDYRAQELGASGPRKLREIIEHLELIYLNKSFSIHH